MSFPVISGNHSNTSVEPFNRNAVSNIANIILSNCWLKGQICKHLNTQSMKRVHVTLKEEKLKILLLLFKKS